MAPPYLIGFFYGCRAYGEAVPPKLSIVSSTHTILTWVPAISNNDVAWPFTRSPSGPRGSQVTFNAQESEFISVRRGTVIGTDIKVAEAESVQK